VIERLKFLEHKGRPPALEWPPISAPLRPLRRCRVGNGVIRPAARWTVARERVAAYQALRFAGARERAGQELKVVRLEIEK